MHLFQIALFSNSTFLLVFTHLPPILYYPYAKPAAIYNAGKRLFQ